MSKVIIKYYGFGGYNEFDEPMGIMRTFSDNRTPQVLHKTKGWTPADHMRTEVSYGEAWDISDEQARKIAERRGFTL